MAGTSKTKELTEVSEAQIAVHWKEEDYYQPSEQFKAQANMRDPRIFEQFSLDRFLEKYASKAAFIFVPEQETERDVVLTYRELYDRVNEVAALLQGLGLKAGDRVTLHMPMVPELPITPRRAHASIVIGRFSGQACGSRIQD